MPLEYTVCIFFRATQKKTSNWNIIHTLALHKAQPQVAQNAPKI